MKKVFGLSFAGGVGFYMFYPTELSQPAGAPYQKLPVTPHGQKFNKHFVTKSPETIGVVGGGISGALVAKTLTQQGYTVRVFDRNSGPGGLWCSNYDGSGLQLPYPHYSLPDFSFPAGTAELPKQDVVRKFIADYIKQFDIEHCFQFNTEISKVEQNPDETWTVHSSDGEKVSFDFLVLSTGSFNLPFIPEVQDKARFKGIAIHSTEFKDAERLVKGKKVLVVGGAKSALDVAGQAQAYGADVAIVMRRPLWLRPIDATLFGLPLSFFTGSRFAYLFHHPFYSERASLVFTYCQPLVELYWKLICHRLAKGLPEELVPQLSFRRTAFYVGGAQNKDVYEGIREGRIRLIKGELQYFTEEGLQIADKEEKADVIIFATGYKRSLLGIDEEHGEWRYRHAIVPGLKNFAVIGILNTYGNPLQTNLQAVWLAEVLRGAVKLPSDQEMRQDIEDRRTYNLSVIPQESWASFSWLPYPLGDQLLKDMGFVTNRKKNRFAYWTEPIKPEDYRLVITHRI